MSFPSPAQPNLPASLAHHLRNARTVLWAFFLAFTLAGFFLLPFSISEETVKVSITSSGLSATLALLVRNFDLIWILLAAVNVYLSGVLADGLPVERIRSGATLGGVALLFVLNHFTQIPFGNLEYGFRLMTTKHSLIPVGLVFFWYTLLISSYQTVVFLSDRIPLLREKAALPIATALLLLLSQRLIEPVASQLRYYWVWSSEAVPRLAPAPLHNSLAWFLIALIFAFLYQKLGTRAPSGRFLVIFGAMNALFLLTRLMS